MSRNAYLVGFCAGVLASRVDGVEAKDLAEKAGISLRVAQRALVSLGKDGVLAKTRRRVGLQGSHPMIWRLPRG